MAIYLEELSKRNGFIKIYDDDALVTIQMSEQSIEKIIQAFNLYIRNNDLHNEIIEVTENNNTFNLSFQLRPERDGFSF